MPITRRGRPPASSRAANPAIIPACVDPVTVQTTIVSKKTPSCSLLLGHLEGPVGEAEAAEPVVGGAGRDGVRRPAAGLDVGDGLLPGVPEADVEAGLVEADLGAHDPAEHDVADAVVDGVGPVDPLLLHQHAAQPEVRRDGGDLPGVVRLVPTDADEGVGALGQRLRHQVLELADLVAAVGQARADVLALGPHRRPAQVRAQPLQLVHRARPEREGVTREVRKTHEANASGTGCGRGARASRPTRAPRSGSAARTRPAGRAASRSPRRRPAPRSPPAAPSGPTRRSRARRG